MTKTGIMLDVETTGLDTARDEVIELAMVKFTYLPDDRIARITDVFSSFNEPQNPIPAEIIDLTGITDEMVLGHRIDPAAVAAFASDAVIVIAHNANARRALIGRLEGDAAGANAFACRSPPGRLPLTPGGEQVSNSVSRRA